MGWEERLQVLMAHLEKDHSSSSSSSSASDSSAVCSNLCSSSPSPSPSSSFHLVGDAAHGGELVAAVLKKQGVKFLFTLIGGHISPIIVASKKEGIRVIDVRHEVNAVFAADAVSRLSPTPGVACVTAGPGLTNTITAVKNASLAQSPLILLGGATTTLLKGRGSLQDIDQQALFAPHVKWQASVQAVRDIVPTLEKAFAIAQAGVPGPVFVELPIDILFPEQIIRAGALEKLKGEDLLQTIAKWYVQRHIENVYGGKSLPLKLTHQKPQARVATESQVNKAFSLISAARKPVVVLGSQTVLRSDKVQQIQQAVEKLRIPVYLSGMARGLLGKASPTQLRHKRGNALKESDLVILVGVPFDFRLGYGQDFSSKTKVLAVNLSAVDISKNRTPTVGIVAEPGDFLVKLSKKAEKNPVDFSEWLAHLKKRDAKRDEEILKMSSDPTDKFLNPLKVCLQMEESLGKDAILVADGGDFVATASYILRPPNPLSWLDPGVFGTLGVGAGFALGAKLCRPESEVWIVWGDGSAGYSIVEYDTFVRHNVPVISVVGNDACWTQIHRDQIEFFGDDAGCMLTFNDYDKIADSLGGRGILVKETEALPEAFAEAKRLASGPNARPVLINALIGKTDFRKGSLSM